MEHFRYCRESNRTGAANISDCRPLCDRRNLRNLHDFEKLELSVV
jgi:hypothetical protein